MFDQVLIEMEAQADGSVEPKPRNHAPTPAFQLYHSLPTPDEVREKCFAVFGNRACSFQVEFTQAVMQRSDDVILEVATGMGKTLAFWLPLLFSPGGIQIVVTALNTLGRQSVESLALHGIRAIAIDGSLSPAHAYQAFQEIESGNYRAIIVSPEQLMKHNGHFDKLFKKSAWLARVISVVFDEAHCITTWGTFRPEYREVGRLRYCLRKDIPFALALATLPTGTCDDICKLLHIRQERLVHIVRSTDRANIQLAVQKIQHSFYSFRDLACILPQSPSQNPPVFLIFCPTITVAVAATKVLWKLMGRALRPQDKILWFSSHMSDQYKTRQIERLRNSELWGLCTTDAFGMGMDLPNIKLVINYGAHCDLSTLWQRFGRCARDPATQGTAILYAERKWFDDEREEAERRRIARAEKAAEKKCKRASEEGDGSLPPAKRCVGPSALESCPVVSGPSERPGTHEAGEEQDGDDEDNEDDEEEDTVEGETAAVARKVQDELEARRELYVQVSKTAKKARKRESQSIEPAMDDLINAGTRVCMGCRRKSMYLYFNSGEPASDHILCDPSSPSGCVRCAPPVPSPCCDCHPGVQAAIDTLYPPSIYTRPKPAKRSPLQQYDQAAMDKELYRKLARWADERTIQRYEEGFWLDMGSGAVLPITILKRIVDCAHFGKIKTIADLQRETKWLHAGKYGEEVLAILTAHYAPPPTTLQAANGSKTVKNANGGATETSKTRKPSEEWVCRACGVMGHTRRKGKCPLYYITYPDKVKQAQPQQDTVNATSDTPEQAPANIPAQQPDSTALTPVSTSSAPSSVPPASPPDVPPFGTPTDVLSSTPTPPHASTVLPQILSADISPALLAPPLPAAHALT